MTTQGYTRQSTSVIVDGLFGHASDFNNEFNDILGAFDASAGHTHDGTTGGGQQIPPAGLKNLSNSTSGLLAANGANGWVNRTLTAPATGLTITNGSGASGNPTFALANSLAAIQAIGTTGTAGLLGVTGVDTWSYFTITPPAAGLSITSGSNAITFALANTLSALQTLGTAAAGGFAANTGSDTWAVRSIVVPTGLSITNPAGVAGNPTISLANSLAALQTLGTAGTGGAVTITGTDTIAVRTITGTPNEITVTNGNGVSGNPTLSFPTSMTMTGITLTGGTYSGITLSGTTAGNTTFSGTLTGGTYSGITLSGTTTNTGATISGGTVSGATLSGSTLSGTTTNSGTISGGTITGSITNSGTITGGTYATMSLSGTITNGGTISGGTISGATISGTTTNSGTLNGGAITGSTFDSGVIGGVTPAAITGTIITANTRVIATEINTNSSTALSLKTSGGSEVQVLNIASATVPIQMTGGTSSLNPTIQTGSNCLVLGSGSALPTTNIAGYVMIPSCAGTPTGIPNGGGVGQIAIIYDTSANKIWCYNGSAWKGVALS